MEQVIDQLKSGQFNQSESMKMMTTDEINSLKRQVEDGENQIQELIKENQKLKGDSDKVN